MTSDTKILWTGPINGLGYGQASAGYAAGLMELGALAGHVNIGGVDPTDPEIKDGECTNKLLRSDLKPEEGWGGPSVGFWHFSHAHEIASGSPRVIMATFEVDDFPPAVLANLSNNFDAIGTASQWGAEILKKRLPNKEIFYAPHAFSLKGDHKVPDRPSRAKRLEMWTKQLRASIGSNTQILGNIGKFEKRKGHYDLLDTVLEIGRERPILLVTAWFNPFMNGHYPFFAMHERDMRPLLVNSPIYLYQKDQAMVLILPRVQSKEGLIGLMRHVDTYVSPAYCEGWDLPLFEMMSHRSHCIASLNTAHLEYCSEDNVTPLKEFDVVPAIDDTPFFSGQGTWNQINREELRLQIDMAHSIGEEARRSIAKKAEADCKQFTWETSAKEILRVVKKLKKSTTQPSGATA